jgi:hypothetical protein
MTEGSLLIPLWSNGGSSSQEKIVTRRFAQAARCLTGSLLLAGASAATAQDIQDPSAVLTAFVETCLGGPQSMEGVRQAAMATGWAPQPARVVSTATGARLEGEAAPQFLRKDDLTLALTSLAGTGDVHACSVSGPIDRPFTTRALAEAVSQRLRAGEPTIQNDGRGERALWQMDARTRIEAGVRRKSSIRTVKLVARSEPHRLALRD